MTRRRRLLPVALAWLAIAPVARAAQTYTCPNQVIARDDGSRASVIVNLQQQTLNVTFNLFTASPGNESWSATADSTFLVQCKTVGQVIDQGSRVLLSCTCAGKVATGDISGIATLTLPAGSQCTYQGNLQFQCE